MEIYTTVLDTEKYEEAKFAPATLVQRAGLDWLVRDLPMDHVPNEQELRKDVWSWCRDGSLVRIPLFPYCSRGNYPEIALGYAFELGVKARDATELQPYTVRKMHICIGNPVTECLIEENKVLRFWIGFGFGLMEK